MTDEIRTPTIRAIQEAVAARFGITVLDLISARRAIQIARPRQIAMWIARHATPHTLPEIGRHFGGRDHTTVIHAIRRVDEISAEQPEFAIATRTLLADVQSVEPGDKRRALLRLVA